MTTKRRLSRKLLRARGFRSRLTSWRGGGRSRAFAMSPKPRIATRSHGSTNSGKGMSTAGSKTGRGQNGSNLHSVFWASTRANPLTGRRMPAAALELEQRVPRGNHHEPTPFIDIAPRQGLWSRLTSQRRGGVSRAFAMNPNPRSVSRAHGSTSSRIGMPTPYGKTQLGQEYSNPQRTRWSNDPEAQVRSQTAPGYFVIVGQAAVAATVTLNTLATYRRGEYLHKEVTAAAAGDNDAGMACQPFADGRVDPHVEPAGGAPLQPHAKPAKRRKERQ